MDNANRQFPNVPKQIFLPKYYLTTFFRISITCSFLASAPKFGWKYGAYLIYAIGVKTGYTKACAVSEVVDQNENCNS